MLGPTPSGLMNLLLCLALMFILIKIPFWFLAPLRSGRRSLIGSLVRGVIAYKTMGLLGGLGSAAGRGGGGGRSPRTGGIAPADLPATRSGQYMLPLPVRRVHNPRRGWGVQARSAVWADPRPGPGQMSLFTASGSGSGTESAVSANPRALPPDSLPAALPTDQVGLPITVRRDPSRIARRSLADDLATRTAAPPVRQPGLLTADGRISRNARPPARLPQALVAPNTGMLPIHLRSAPPHPARHPLADQLADPAHTAPARQRGPGLITPSGRINPTARPPRPPADAYTGNRPLASGQYPLPLRVRRQPKPTPPPVDPPPRPAAGTQLRLPLDLPPRRPRKK